MQSAEVQFFHLIVKLLWFRTSSYHKRSTTTMTNHRTREHPNTAEDHLTTTEFAFLEVLISGSIRKITKQNLFHIGSASSHEYQGFLFS